MTSDNTETSTRKELPPIGTAVRLDMSERLTIPIPSASDPEPEDAAHPGLNPRDIETIVETAVGFGGDHRNRVREGFKRLTDYIEYLERLRCDSCSAHLGYHSYEGRMLCGPCANGEQTRVRVVGGDLRAVKDIPGGGGVVRLNDSSNAEHDALWIHIVGGTHTNSAIEGVDQASLELGMHSAVMLAKSIGTLVLARGYSLPRLLEALTTELEAEPDVEAPAPAIDTAAVPEGRYDIGADGALWVERWSAERHYADGLAAELARIASLHTPYVDEHGRKRCRGCIAGYDPRTGQLTDCAWPCPTERARTGEA